MYIDRYNINNYIVIEPYFEDFCMNTILNTMVIYLVFKITIYQPIVYKF